MTARHETATECVEWRCTTAPALARSRYIARWRKLSLVGASPATCLPEVSSVDSFAESSAPSETLVGDISQPSAVLTLMLPELPKVRRRSNIDLPAATRD